MPRFQFKGITLEDTVPYVVYGGLVAIVLVYAWGMFKLFY